MIACAGEQQGEVNKIRLGKFLAAHEGSIVDGLAFQRDDKCKNAVRWMLTRAGKDVAFGGSFHKGVVRVEKIPPYARKLSLTLFLKEKGFS